MRKYEVFLAFPMVNIPATEIPIMENMPNQMLMFEKQREHCNGKRGPGSSVQRPRRHFHKPRRKIRQSEPCRDPHLQRENVSLTPPGNGAI
jgi:hypothetical protein